MDTYLVEGMSCGHCVASVTRAVSAVDGVERVEVDLDARTLAVAGDAPVDEFVIAAAVAEAGYTLAGRA